MSNLLCGERNDKFNVAGMSGDVKLLVDESISFFYVIASEAKQSREIKEIFNSRDCFVET